MLSSPFDEVVLLLHVAEECLAKAIASYAGCKIELDEADLHAIRDTVRYFRRQFTDQPRRLSSKRLQAILRHHNANQANPRGLEGAAIALGLAAHALESERCLLSAAMRFAFTHAVMLIESA
ncbi:MAG TPA: hypothetical protein VFE62_02665 [Gemmataceae bacterium]|nr:hypothetical protein [Gemmataceae bacterium]